MYSVSNTGYKNKGKLLDKTELVELDGFMMGSSRKVFKINGANIRKINVVSKKLANPIVSQKVLKRYDKLIELLTDLLVDDDGSGTSLREALNQIEKFKITWNRKGRGRYKIRKYREASKTMMEIKNKYRKFLKQKELEMMSKQLMALQKEAKIRLFQLQESYYKFMEASNRRSR